MDQPPKTPPVPQEPLTAQSPQSAQAPQAEEQPRAAQAESSAQPAQKPHAPGYARPASGNTVYKAAAQRTPYGFIKQDGRFALLMALMGFLFVRLIFAGGGGVSVTVFTVLFDAFLLWYMSARQIKPTSVTWAYLAFTLAFGVYFGLYGGGGLGFFTLLFLIALCAYTVYAALGARTEASLRYVVSDTCHALFVMPFSHFDAAPKAVGHNYKGKGSRRILYAVLGVVLALPLFAIVGNLLGSADPAFERIWKSLVDAIFGRLHITVMQFIVGLPIAMYLFGLMYGAIRRRANPRTAEQAGKTVRACRVIPLPLALGVVIPLLALYVLFFAAQTQYLIAAFQGVTPEGISHAEYARRGFFELCAVCSINMLTLIGLYFFTKTEREEQDGFWARCRPAGICAVLLCLFSMALAVMSLRKMLLYIEDLGLTQKRLYTSFFMVFLFVAFGLTIIGLFRRSFTASRWIAVSGASILLVLCLINANGLIARHYIWRYQERHVSSLDVTSMTLLGEAAVPPLAALLESGDCSKETEREIRGALAVLYYGRYAPRSVDWRRMTFTRLQSMAVLERLEREGKITSSDGNNFYVTWR